MLQNMCEIKMMYKHEAKNKKIQAELDNKNDSYFKTDIPDI